MAAFTSTSTSADPNNSSYDVFISHRGPDVKKTLASHLYRRLIPYGLRVFLDYEELKVGENLTPQIEGAIASASVQVAIFSPGYAGSNWCLDELLHILKSGAPIIPIFYGVKPADLRWTHEQGQGVYARALDNLAKKRTHDSQQPRYNSTTIENWRNALSSVPETSGLDLEAFNGDEGMLLDKVIESVLKRIKKPQLNVAKYPTGLDGKVQDFEKTISLKQHSERVEVVGIAGFGGVGKTTLAKELFNSKSSKYCNSCFLFDVRGNTGSSLVSLQNKLLSSLTPLDLRIQSVDQGIEMLRKHLSSSHVLIVLDDVDNVAQVDALLPLNVLGPGSLILITSRDKDVLARSGIQQSSIYELTGLDAHHSKDLFCSYAFCQSHPPSGFESLVHRFLGACKGLPLSLKVLGGLLNGNTDKSYWEAQLVKVQNTLRQEIQKSLQISYDALEREEKQIFLDIACFFVGEMRDTAIKIWEGSGWKGSLAGFQSLQMKCLVELDTENKIIMHDHLIDLGRDLAKEPGLPRRLWGGIKNIDDFMQQSSGITHVRGFRYVLNNYQNDNEIEDDFALFSCYKIKKLELLDIASLPLRTLVSREFQPFDPEILVERILSGVLSPKLIWLRWHECHLSSLPSWIPMKNLLVLEARGTKMKTLWQTEKQAPLQLLELRICAPLSNIPVSIGQLSRLEKIVVDSGNFEKLPEEFGRLLSLKTLVLKRCSKMRYLPEAFGNLRSLEKLDLFRCVKLKRLPGLAQLTELRTLRVFGCCELEELDFSRCVNLVSIEGLEHLTELQTLMVNGCSKFEVLDLSGCVKLKSLPGLAQLTELGTLIVSACSDLEELPGVDNMRSLKYLDVSGCVKLKSLPGLAQLTELGTLDVSGCSDLEELPGVDNMRSLKYLDVSGCVKLKSLPGLAQLTELEALDVSRCSDLEELPGVDNIRSLKYLDVFGCVTLKSLPGLLQLTEHRIVELPGVDNMRSLRYLDVSGCAKSLPGFRRL